jgi:hypothetical protein
MKYFLSLLFLSFFFNYAKAQNAHSTLPSPPASTIGKVNNATITVNYHQPAVKNRDIWNAKGKIAPYGKLWRTGANNATTFETSKDITIDGQKLAAGKYALFSIPNEKEWIFIFNKTWDQWGAYDYSKKEDALRITVKPNNSNILTERFKIDLDADKFSIAWGTVKAGFTIKN